MSYHQLFLQRFKIAGGKPFSCIMNHPWEAERLFLRCSGLHGAANAFPPGWAALPQWEMWSCPCWGACSHGDQESPGLIIP